MLNYDAMKCSKMKRYATLLVLAVLASACSGPAENQGSSNTNAPPAQANSNSSSPQPQIAQGNPPAVAPGPVPPTVQQIPPPPKSAAAGNANAANATNGPAAGNARAPKLVAPEKQIDFGKQPQNKNLVRPIVIKNGGRADLNIESVVPS